eukprot:gene15048-17806_t
MTFPMGTTQIASDTSGCKDVGVYIAIVDMPDQIKNVYIDPIIAGEPQIKVTNVVVDEKSQGNNNVRSVYFYSFPTIPRADNIAIKVNIYTQSSTPTIVTNFTCKVSNFKTLSGVTYYLPLFDNIYQGHATPVVTCQVEAVPGVKCRINLAMNCKFVSLGGSSGTSFRIGVSPSIEASVNSPYPGYINVALISPSSSLLPPKNNVTINMLDLTSTTITDFAIYPGNGHIYPYKVATRYNNFAFVTLNINTVQADVVYFDATIKQNNVERNGRSYVVYSNSSNVVLLTTNSFDKPSSASQVIPVTPFLVGKSVTIQGIWPLNYESAYIIPPTLKGIEMRSLPSGRSHILSVSFKDAISGCSFIKVEYDSKSFSVILREEDLVSGTTVEGVFEKEVQLLSVSDFEIIVTLTDAALQSRVYKSGDAFSIDYTTSTPILVPYYVSQCSGSITPNSSGQIITVNVLLNVTDIALKPAMIMDFVPYNTKSGQVMATGVITPGRDNFYRFKFDIPLGIPPGFMRWKLLTSPPVNYTSGHFDGIVQSTGGDIRPPLLTGLVKKSVVLPINSDYVSTGWDFTISSPTGFINGTFGTKSDLDPLPYYTVITGADRISGNEYNGVYSVVFNIQAPPSKCVTQSYTIDYVELVGQNFSISATNMTIDPYMPIRDTAPLDAHSITIQCASTPVTTPPQILFSGTMLYSVDVGSQNRTVSYVMAASHNVGISLRHKPFVYMTSFASPLLKFPFEMVENSNNGTRVTYNATCTIPYGYGSSGSDILVAFYGVMSNHYSLAGLSFDQTNIVITRTFTRTPLLESHSSISTSGGELTLYGRNFGYDTPPTVSYASSDDPNTPSNQQIFFASSTLLIINIPPFANEATANIFLKVGKIQSNTLNINPWPLPVTPSPTPTSTPSPSPTSTPTDTPSPTPTANKIIVPTNHTVLPNEPTVNIDIDNDNDESVANSTISSTIKIVKLIELDAQGQTLVSIPLDVWTFSNESAIGHTKYVYSVSVSPSPTVQSTNITVYLEWFDSLKVIEFAGLELNVQPFTLKYSINMTSYSFSSATNTLQLVMEAEMVNQDKNQTSCSVSNHGATDEQHLDWIKMTVNGRSLFGQFLPRCILDKRPVRIGATLLNKDSVVVDSHLIKSQIAINIPHYSESINIDPNFGFLVEGQDSDVDTCSSKKKSNIVLIAAIVAGIVGAAIITIGVVFLFKKRFRLTMIDKSIKLVKRR